MNQPEKNEESKYDEWAVDHALRTLCEAEELKKDSKMMELVQKKAKKKMASIKSVAGLRNEYNKMVGPDKDEN